MKSKVELDQFFTKEEIALDCLKEIFFFVELQGLEKVTWIEPSAGDGAFLLNLPVDNRVGIDLDKKLDEVIKRDFLKYKIPQKKYKNVVVVGNPPFGKKSKLAVEFINHSASFDNVKTIAFIIPIQFRKWSVQSKINKNLKLALDMDLPENSFLFNGKDYDVRCCFQIWTFLDGSYEDLRMKEKPLVKHKDFEMWQYNNTKVALKVFEEDFDFAVPRQGFQDYERKEYYGSNCEKNKQWILFKAKNENVLNRLKSLDFVKLSKKNTTTPGFGKADVVEEYSRLYNQKGDL